MHKRLIAWATGALMGLSILAGPALAQTSGSSNTGKTTAPAGKQAPSSSKGQSDAHLKAAQAACHSRKGGDQKTCIDEVMARHRQSQAEVGGKTGAARTPTSPDSVPAVQTQSSTVGATGVAPSTTGPDRTPGTPAVPRK